MPSDEEIMTLFRSIPDTIWGSDIVKFARVLLSRYGSGQPAASAEPPKLTDDEIERLVIQLGVTWKEDAWKIEDADLHPMVRALLYRYTAAPVAQEPVIPTDIRETIQRALVAFRDSQLERQRALQAPEKKGVSIYGAARIAAQRNMDDADAAVNWLSAPVAAQAQPSVPDVLFDGYAVLSALDDKARSRTSPENVSDVLDAVVRLVRATPPADGQTQPPSSQDREDATPNRDAVDLAREGMELYKAGQPEYIVCKELVRIADAARAAKEKP